MDKRTLYFFTHSFPYGLGETFIENELPFLCDKFERVVIFPAVANENPSKARSLPKNAEVKIIHPVNRRLRYKEFNLLLKILLNEFWMTKKKKFFLKSIRQRRSEVKQAILKTEFIDKDESGLYFSFWMNAWCLALAALRIDQKIQSFFFRCGGFDIWDSRWKNGYIPFQSLIYKHSSGVYPNTQLATKYLKEKKLYPEKISCQYWGTNDYGFGPFDSENVFTIVSCSNLIPLKRVHLIVEVLSFCNFEYKWYHFGDGEKLNEVLNYAQSKLPEGKFEFKGNVSNKNLMQFYKNNQVNLFISTSETEGLPVSMQEAISFGIPLLGTDVGGVSEIVNENTGILIDADFECKNIADIIVEFANSKKNSAEFRKSVRDFWKNNFYSASVYPKFLEKL